MLSRLQRERELVCGQCALVCVSIRTHMCTGGGQGKASGVLPNHPPAYSLETESLTAPGAGLAASDLLVSTLPSPG